MIQEYAALPVQVQMIAKSGSLGRKIHSASEQMSIALRRQLDGHHVPGVTQGHFREPCVALR